jgi:hypothetical protein
MGPRMPGRKLLGADLWRNHLELRRNHGALRGLLRARPVTLAGLRQGVVTGHRRGAAAVMLARDRLVSRG